MTRHHRGIRGRERMDRKGYSGNCCGVIQVTRQLLVGTEKNHKILSQDILFSQRFKYSSVMNEVVKWNRVGWVWTRLSRGETVERCEDVDMAWWTYLTEMGFGVWDELDLTGSGYAPLTGFCESSNAALLLWESTVFARRTRLNGYSADNV